MTKIKCMSKVIENINWDKLLAQRETLVAISVKKTVGKKDQPNIDGLIGFIDQLKNEYLITNKNH